MSWSGFKKGFKRAGITILQTTGRIEKTTDKDFEAEIKDLKLFEPNVIKTGKTAKKCLEKIKVMSVSQKRMAEALQILSDMQVSDAAGFDKYQEGIGAIDNLIKDDFEPMFRLNIIDPIRQFAKYIDHANNLITKRKHKLLDYDAIKTKYNKSSKPQDYEGKYRQRKEIFERLNEMLTEGIPALLQIRTQYFEASVEAFVQCQMMLFYEIARALEKSEKSLSQDSIYYSKETAEKAIGDAVLNIRKLSIVS